MAGRHTLVAIATLLLTPALAHAHLVFTLSGLPTSNVIQYEASGSVTVTQNYGSVTSSLGLGPAGGNWTSGFDNNLGDFLNDSMNTSFNDDLVLSGGGVSYRRNGVQFGILDTLDLDGAVGGGGDDVELDPTLSISYPSLTAGDVLSWVGSGTFTLEDGETFDSLFTSTGMFSNAIDGGSYIVNITTSAVPEPSSAIFLGFTALVGCAFRRRRLRNPS